jgi:linoleoyl-CoA desaturase
VLGVYYFTLALMNHNDERVTSSVDERNAAKDWGEAQVHSSADWATNLTWWQSLAHMFLNYHTVHHLFPRIDACHFPALHAILTETCQEFDIEYYDSNFLTVYKGLYHSLSTPLSLAK